VPRQQRAGGGQTTPTAATAVRYRVLDEALPGRPPLAQTQDYQAALYQIDRLHSQWYDQLDANDEGGAGACLALVVAPVDAAGVTGPVCHRSIVNSGAS